jgi:AraC family transcriptional regulator of adaptative response/methylated-DNA-[protein]-cysteine methyltransferase
LHRNFKRATGLTPKAYAKAYRGRHVRAALQRRGSSVTDAAYLSGYEASSSFYKDAPAMLGMAPQSYRRRGQDQRIRFALAECSLGSLLVASTQTGRVLRAAGR